MKKYILGIESSCDDTSVALVETISQKYLDCITISSSSIQNQYGGVVPEIAAREHEKHFLNLIDEIMKKHQLTWDSISHIAYTECPGLFNCLLVGKILAQTLSFIFSKPLIPINHVHAHAMSIGLTEKIVFPFIALVVSGKTTSFFLVESSKKIIELDSTKDNALGEVYDKVARKMGLGYPGGKKIDALFDPNLKVVSLLKNQLDPKKTISYSGIMTASFLMWEKIQKNSDITNKTIYFSTVFQKFVIDNLINKIKYWLLNKNVFVFAISGGVASNSYLKKKIKDLKVKTWVVDDRFAQDNAAMIAYLATWLIK